MLLATDLGEAWLPVDAAHAGCVVERRDLYLPAGRPDGAGPPTAEVVSGIVLYALGVFLLALILLQVRVRGLAQMRPARSPPHRPVTSRDVV